MFGGFLDEKGVTSFYEAACQIPPSDAPPAERKKTLIRLKSRLIPMNKSLQTHLLCHALYCQSYSRCRGLLNGIFSSATSKDVCLRLLPRDLLSVLRSMSRALSADFYTLRCVILGECHLVCWRGGQPHSAGPGEVQIASVRHGLV